MRFDITKILKNSKNTTATKKDFISPQNQMITT